MKQTITRAALMGLVCLTAFHQAQAAEHVLYDASKFPAKGTVITETETMAMTECAMVMEMQGQKMNGSMTRNGEAIKVATIDSDTQITVVVQKDSSVGSVTMMGQQQPAKEEKEPLHGQTVILTKAEGKWTGKLKEGEATEKQQKKIDKLVKKYNGESDAKHIYGTTPRKVGDSWDVDPSKVSSFGNGDQKLAGTYKVTFKGIEKFQGDDCAVLVADIDVTGATGDGDMKMNVKGQFRVLRSLKHLIDLEKKMQGKMKMNGTINKGAGTMGITGPMTATEKAEVKLP